MLINLEYQPIENSSVLTITGSVCSQLYVAHSELTASYPYNHNHNPYKHNLPRRPMTWAFGAPRLSCYFWSMALLFWRHPMSDLVAITLPEYVSDSPMYSISVIWDLVWSLYVSQEHQYSVIVQSVLKTATYAIWGYIGKLQFKDVSHCSPPTKQIRKLKTNRWFF